MADDEPKQKLYTPSKRGKKQAVEEDPAAVSEAPGPLAAAEEEEETDATTTVDDGLPHPRVSFNVVSIMPLLTGGTQPFESRRDFFQRTSNEWQEVLMTSLRWKGVQPESLTIKEIKSKAFEMSETKWWDCREEITALEDEQEAAGIGEVVSLADRGEGGQVGGGGGRRR